MMKKKAVSRVREKKQNGMRIKHQQIIYSAKDSLKDTQTISWGKDAVLLKLLSPSKMKEEVPQPHSPLDLLKHRDYLDLKHHLHLKNLMKTLTLNSPSKDLGWKSSQRGSRNEPCLN